MLKNNPLSLHSVANHKTRKAVDINGLQVFILLFAPKEKLLTLKLYHNQNGKVKQFLHNIISFVTILNKNIV